MITATPTRITIEVYPATPVTSTDQAAPAVVRVLSPAAAQADAAGAVGPLALQGVEPHGAPVPASYRPAPCTCLDVDGCMADHGND